MSTFIPAYKDTFFEASVSSLDFYIMTDNVVIFKGRAIKSPSEDKLRININKIAKDYLEHSLPDFREADKVVLPNAGAFRFFELYRTDGTLLQTYGVLFDWEGDFDGSTKILSSPIRPNVSAQMKLPFTIYSPSGETAIIVWSDEGYGLFFDNLTRSIVFPYTGGRAVIEFSTNFPYDSITASATTTGYTVGEITPTSVTVTSNVNSGSSIWNAQIVFLYNGEDVGWDRTSVTTFDSGSTPVTGITWDSGITVNRECWATTPFSNGRDPIVYITSHPHQYNTEKIWTTNSIYTGQGGGRTFTGAGLNEEIPDPTSQISCPCPYTFRSTKEWLGTDNGSVVKIWRSSAFGTDGFNINNNSGDTVLEAVGSVYNGINKVGETTFKQIYSGYTGYDNYSTGYPHRFIEVGPFADSQYHQLDSIKNAFKLYNLPDFCATKVFPDGSIFFETDPQKTIVDMVDMKRNTMTDYRNGGYYITIYTKYPTDAFGGNFGNLPAFTINIPLNTKAIFDLRLNSGSTLNFEGSKEEYKRIYKAQGGVTQSGTTNPVVQCVDGLIGANAMTLHQEEGWSGVCSDCTWLGYNYEYPKAAGDPTSTYIYYSGTTNSGWTVYDSDYMAMTPISNTQNGNVGVLRFPRPPYKIVGRIAQWYRSDSLVIGAYNGSFSSSGGTNPLCEIGSGGTVNGETLELKNLVSGYFNLNGNSNLIVPNARSLTLRKATGSSTNIKVFCPSVDYLNLLNNMQTAINGLTIGPHLHNGFGSQTFTALTEINFNAPSSVFYLWNDEYGTINLENFPNLQTVHTLDADIHIQ